MAKQPQKLEPKKQLQKSWKRLRHINIRDENHLLFASFIILMAALLIVNTIYIMNKVPNNWFHSTTSWPTLTKVLTSQQAAVTDAYHINISDVTESDKPDPAFRLDDTQTMLILKISITNKTAGEQNIVPVNQFFVRSRDGDTLGMHPSSQISKGLDSGPLAPGKTASGQISFAVPKSLAHPLLYVDLGWNDYVPVVFDVLR